ncbi:MAG: hydrogenase maturation nickel metallochaperone HypA [Candidatus Marinimicrobia bacterium]|nr:hydrogenase maturation nickel metallochaperone HypA [Candidatus Neomarinimicrobiota bacterium]MCF7828468.1 hydrogenase maturation nickel metallochaperone HypA [Candidatus Neomarinimicrobiota bacterium]MCF7881958.1 hydrogenase maturation nickel metallochaperone HypA [Candidatus Neomarinimicrobiota bacterium]
MHEMSIATNILEIAEQSMDGHDQLLSISVEIGELAGIEFEALEFCFEALKQSSRYPDLTLDITRIPGKGNCRKCGVSVPMKERFAVCPECGGYTVEPSQGQELRVTSIEVE